MKFIFPVLIFTFLSMAQYPDTILGSISVGQNPSDVCISPDGNTAYVAVGFGFATVIDISDYSNYSMIGLININGTPAAVECDSSGAFLYIADNENNLLHIANTSTLTVVKELNIQPEPTDMIRYSEGNKIYLSHENGMITVINTETQLIDEYFWVGTEINSICIDNSEELIVAADNESPQEALINPISGLLTHFTSGMDSYGCTFSGNGDFLFLSCPSWNIISVINSTTMENESTISCPNIIPRKMASLPNLPFLYGVCPNDNKLLVINTEDFTLEGEIVLPGEPVSIVAHPDGERLFITCLSDNKLKAIGFDPSGINASSPSLFMEAVNSPAEIPSINITAQNAGNLVVRTFDLSGRIVWEKSTVINRNEIRQFNIELGSKGLHIVTATMNGTTCSLKVITL